MKVNLRFFLALLVFASEANTLAFANASAIPVSESRKVLEVAQLIDHRHPARVDGESKQCFLEITAIKEQVEAIAPKIPTLKFAQPKY